MIIEKVKNGPCTGLTPRNVTILTNTREIELGWKHYFETLLNTQPIAQDERLEFDVTGSADPDIAVGEVNNALKKMGNGKAPGANEIPA